MYSSGANYDAIRSSVNGKLRGLGYPCGVADKDVNDLATTSQGERCLNDPVMREDRRKVCITSSAWRNVRSSSVGISVRKPAGMKGHARCRAQLKKETRLV